MKKNWHVLLLAALWLLCALISAAVAEDAIDAIVEDLELPLDETSAVTDELELPSVDDVPEIDPDLDIVLGGASEDGQAVDDNLPELSLDGGISLPDENPEGREAAQANAGEDSAEFVIDKNGVLTKYNGAGGAVVIPDTVTAIGDKAFWDCDSLTAISIPGTVTAIGKSAFQHSDALKSITIPGSVKSIADSAFYDCRGLSSVKLEAGVETIGASAFESCDVLKTLTMGDGLKTVKGGAFRYSPIEALIFPDSVTVLDASAIQDSGYSYSQLFKSLKKVHWPAGVKEVHIDQFRNFSALETVEIAEGITSIGNSAFWDCDSLTAISIPGTVTAIGESAFRYSDALKSITIPGNVKSIADCAFYDCRGLSSVKLEAGVETIGASAFESCDVLKSLTMGDGLKTVKGGAFRYSPIEALIFPDSVTVLDASAIQDSGYSYSQLFKSLKKVHWPAKVKEVHTNQFSSFSALKDAEIPKGVTSIGDNAFLNCAKLSSVTISSSVKKIADSSFNNCPKLEIKTPAGSAAETYAQSSDIPVVHTDEKGRVIKPKQVKLSKTKATLVVGSQLTLKATVKPANATTTLTWKSSNKKVATVTKKGVVKALKKGTATITVRTANGKKATCKITVPAAPTDVTLNETKATLAVGKKLTLKAKLKGAGAKTTLTWKSSNRKVATVSKKGVVKALKKGTTVITVRTANGKKATCRITVK